MVHTAVMKPKHTHPLVVWSRKNGFKISFLAQKVGIGATAMSRYINCRCEAPLSIRLAFELITNGEVKADRWPPVVSP